MNESEGLQRVRDRAYKDKDLQFTCLLHHATLDVFRAAFYELNNYAAAGIDRICWYEYKGEDTEGDRMLLDEKLSNLRERVFIGRYKPLPVSRVYIPKANGKM